MPGRPAIRLVAAVAALGLLAACTTDPYTGEKQISKTATGAAIGGAAGAAIGAVSGGNRGKRAAIGAGIGVLAGGAVGAYMDVQESKLRARLQGTGVSVTRVGDNLILNMPGNVTFATDSSDIKGDFYSVLNSVALVLKEYEKTLVEITGYTDSTGSDSYNQTLSERRAASVGQYLAAQGVAPVRITTQGAGERAPIASNETPEGRQQNRRVELKLVPLTA
jgi:outer membrane protein OmpA-like peptidoglycan-associated protein